MSESPLDAVTGAASFTGKYIANRLLERGRRVRSLARRWDSRQFGDEVEWRPLDFGNPAELAESLHGVQTLYNTYWIRFPHAGHRYQDAVENTRLLVHSAKEAGVRRFVQISVTHASPDSPWPYFRGKAETERIVRDSGLSYAIVRPTLVYGVEDILINNIAWLLRTFPLFLIPGDGEYRSRPIFVGDVAQIAVEAGESQESFTTDAAGPDVLTFNELVELERSAVRSRSLILHVPPALALAAGKAVKLLIRDELMTREEMEGLMGEVIMSDEPPRGTTRFADWLHDHANTLGRRYTSEYKRHWA